MNDYTNPRALGAHFGHDIIQVELGPCKIGVQNLDEKAMNTPAVIEGTILYETKFRGGKFQVIAFNPKGTNAINFLYLNAVNNCFKYWVWSKDELMDYLYNPDSAEIDEGELTKEQEDAIQGLLEKYSFEAP